MRANWSTSAQVRLYLYAGSCSVTQAEANQCGTPVLLGTASNSPATSTTSASVAAGIYTVRLENMGPGATGAGQFEVTLVQ